MTKYLVISALESELDQDSAEELAEGLLEVAREHLSDEETLQLVSVASDAQDPDFMFDAGDGEAVSNHAGELVGHVSTRGSQYIVSLVGPQGNETHRASGQGDVDPLEVLRAMYHASLKAR